MDPRLREYMLRSSVRETAELRELREVTSRMEQAEMQISPEQGQLLNLLARLAGAERVVEVGTFTGYSALWTALALPPGGRLYALDVSEEWTSVARRFWERAGLSGVIELRLGPASETLRELLSELGPAGLDMAFIDADKKGYPEYFELCLELCRPGGLVAVDNVFRGGAVLAPGGADAGTEAILDLNRMLATDERVFVSMLPVGDGLTLAVKR